MSDNVEIVKKTQPLKRRQKLAMALLGAVILSSGFVLGASSTFFFLRERIRPVPPPFPSGRLLQRWTKDLQLSADQQEEAKFLIDELHKKFTIVREDVGKRMKGHYDEMVAGMKTILTEEQFAKWETDLNARIERRKGRGGNWRGGRRGNRGPGRGRSDKSHHAEGHSQRIPPGNEPNQGPRPKH